MRFSLFRRVLAGALATAALVGAAVVGVATPASAVSATVLCQGYAGCADLGMFSHGYSSHSGTEYWRMIAGHNCTNYAAYMVRVNGGPSARPWSGNGNASAWGGANKKLTTTTPAIGAVAWWDANKDGAGWAGHVAYVEAVIDAHTIVISEDNYGGDYFWKVLHDTDAGWPTGFIHFADVAGAGAMPALRANPTSTTYSSDAAGRTAVDPLHVKPGATVYARMTFQNTGRTAWSSVRLASTASSYLGVKWSSKAVAVQATVSAAVGAFATVTVPLTMPADATDFVKHPVSLVMQTSTGTAVPGGTASLSLTTDSRDYFSRMPTPLIAGTAQEGQALTVTTGSWPSQATLALRWYRDGKAIAGGVLPTYTLTSADVGHLVTVGVSATATGYIPATRTSTATALVRSIHSTTFHPGQYLAGSDQRVSVNGRYAFEVTSGAVHIVDRFAGRTTWSTGNVGAVKLSFWQNGQLVAYAADGHSVWKTTTGGKGVVRGAISSTGRFVLSDAASKSVWSVQ